MKKSSGAVYNKYLQNLCIDDEQLAKLKQANLNLLQDLHDICVKNDITYSIAYGTMLGAVRHAGFIPWDDDIDVVMKRADYEKFRKIVAEEYGKDFWVRDRDSEKICPYYFGKFMKKGTVLTECQMEGFPQKYGIYIDIFVLDYVPQSGLKRKIAKFNFTLGARMASLSCDFRFPSRTIMEAGKKHKELGSYYKKRRLLGFFASILPIRFWTKLSLRAVRSEKPSDKLWTGIWLKIQPATDMENLKEYEFEGRKFFGFADYDAYLKSQYGNNYMQLPPEEKRERHMIIEMKLDKE